MGVDILNPITEPVVLDDKLSILDIRACDQSGRQFNVEMQMVPHPSLRGRFLYYWAKLYSSQLKSGDRYQLLRPVVSICFVDALVFPQTDQYHLPFGLWEPQTQLTFSDHLTLHLFQLPNFIKAAKQLREPLDLWLYFLNNGMWLDPENLPEPLRFLELEEAMDILKNLTQEEIERQRYEQREKARRDALSWEKALEDWQQEVERSKQEVERSKQEVEQATEQAAENLLKGQFIGQVRLCEKILKRAPVSDEELHAMSVDQLEQLAGELEIQLPS